MERITCLLVVFISVRLLLHANMTLEQVFENEEKLIGYVFWEHKDNIERKFQVEFKLSCDSLDKQCNKHNSVPQACVEVNGYYVIFWCDLILGLNHLNRAIVQKQKPAIRCTKKAISDINAAMLNKTKDEIIVLLGKPKFETKSAMYYEMDSGTVWNNQYKQYMGLAYSIKFEFQNNIVSSYNMYKNAEY